MSKYKLTRAEASEYGWEGLKAYNFKFPDINDGMSVVLVETTSEHGEIENKERKRIYYMLDGDADFVVGGEKFIVSKGELAVVPPKVKYNYFPRTPVVKALLIMELNQK